MSEFQSSIVLRNIPFSLIPHVAYQFGWSVVKVVSIINVILFLTDLTTHSHPSANRCFLNSQYMKVYDTNKPSTALQISDF